jgi:phage virion morphogenesis protein
MISVQIDDREVKRLLQDLIIRGGDLQDPLRRIGESIQEMVDLSFTTQQSPEGSPWAPLTALTLSRRRDGGIGGVSILRDTGLLAGSYMINRLTRKDLEVGTKDIRAGTHQYGAAKGAYGRTSRGGPIPWGNIPARPMLPAKDNPELLKDIRRILIQFITGAKRGGVR